MFTKEDAQDDAKIKNEVGPDMIRTAKSRSPTIFEHFENVCENMNQDPQSVLADMLVKALNNQDFADRIAEEEVTMEVINTGTYRKDDIEMVVEMADAFDLTPEEEDDNIVDRIINNRLEAVSGPFDKFNRDRDKKRKSDGEVRELKNHISRLERKIEMMETDDTSDEAEVSERPSSENSGKKSIDELFGDEDEEEVVEEDSGEDVTETPQVSIDVTKSEGDRMDDVPDGEGVEDVTEEVEDTNVDEQDVGEGEGRSEEVVVDAEGMEDEE